MEIGLRAASNLAEFVPPSGRLSLKEGSDVEGLLKQLGINSDLVMLIVIDGVLGDMDSTLSDGMAVELIPPISGG